MPFSPTSTLHYTPLGVPPYYYIAPLSASQRALTFTHFFNHTTMADDNYQADSEIDSAGEEAPPISSALTSTQQTTSVNKSSIGRGLGITNSGDHQKCSHITTPHVRRNPTHPGLKPHGTSMPLLHKVNSPVFEHSLMQADGSPPHVVSYKIRQPKPFTMGDNFKTYRMVFTNYIRDVRDLETQKSLLLGLMEHRLFPIVQPIVSRGQSLQQILDEMQVLFSPEEELGTKLAAFQALYQLPGENIQRFAVRVTELGHEAHPDLNERSIQGYLVAQLLKGLQNTALKETIRLLGPQTLHQAVQLVKRAQTGQIHTTIAQIRSESEIICQLCKICGHTAQTCRKFQVSQRKANPNGFQRTYPQPPPPRPLFSPPRDTPQQMRPWQPPKPRYYNPPQRQYLRTPFRQPPRHTPPPQPRIFARYHLKNE